MAGCSSSNNSKSHDNDVDPDFGLVDPEFGNGIPTWGGGNDIDPDFGLPSAPVQPPVDDDNMTPDRPSPDFGDDMPTWGGECGSPDGGANCGALPPKPGVGVPDRPIPEADRIDRQSVRDSIRARLNK